MLRCYACYAGLSAEKRLRVNFNCLRLKEGFEIVIDGMWIDGSSRMLVKCTVDKLPESVNRIWRNKTGGGTYKTAKAKAWQEEMTLKLRTARKYPTYGGEVKMILKIEKRGRRRFDLDNRIKTVQDCLEPAGIIENDAQVVELHCFKRMGAAKDLCTVEIWKA